MNSKFRSGKIFFFMGTTAVLFGDCVQQYISPDKSPATGYLVVNGYISGNGATEYSLTRSIPLPGDSAIPAVTGAIVQVEGSDNSVYPLAEEGNGRYAAGSLALNTAVKYRLRIQLAGGESYLSDYVPYKPTPPIDSVNWIQNASGVGVYVNTHDPANATRYYQWSFEQTFEYHAAESSGFVYDTATGTVDPRTTAQMIYYCWRDIPPTNLVVGTSAKLAQDVIFEFPLLNIPVNSQELSMEYSILVTQYALSDSGYQFLSQMAGISESLGSIFDVQPAQLTGNIHSLSDPGEPVIGYIQAGTVQQQRIFINNNELKDWIYYDLCPDKDTIVSTDPPALEKMFGALGYVPISQNFGPKPPAPGWFANQVECVDCRSWGGSNQKPAWWPN